jgi:hypothetical protein
MASTTPFAIRATIMKRKLLISISVIWAITLYSTSVFAAKDKVYTWTDDKGVVHYGERPPKDSQAALVRTRTGHSEPPPVAPTPGTPPITAPAPAVEPPSLKDPERCNIARKNLEALNSAARIRMPGEDGNVRILTEEDKAAQRETMQSIIDQACE